MNGCVPAMSDQHLQLYMLSPTFADAYRTDGVDLNSQRYFYSSFGCSNTEDTIAGIIDSLRVNGLWKRGRPDMPMTVEHRSPGAINDNTNEQRRQTWLPKHSLFPFY